MSFDRVRENLRTMRSDALSHVINTSVNQCLSRTLITSLTTALAVLALYLLGGEVLRGFAFTTLVGVMAGTYSTMFIAATIAVAMGSRKDRTQKVAQASRAPDVVGRP